jgi:hypothetical protein
VKRPAQSLVLVLAFAGCRASEPLAGDRTTTAEPVLAVSSTAEPTAEGPAGTEASTAAVEGKATDDKPTSPEGTAVAVGGTPTEGTPTEGQPTEGKPLPADPALVPAEISPFFASDSDEALADARYTARKLPKRPGEILGLLDVRPLLGQPVLAAAKPSAEVIATLEPAGITTPTDSCMWVSFQQELEWTKGRIRCGDVFMRNADTGESFEYLVPVLQTVTRDGARWSRIIATNDGRTGWVKTDRVPLRFSKILARYAAGGSRTWDRMLYAEPGQSPVKVDFRGAVAFEILETRKVDGRIWLRVAARVDQCLENSKRKLGEGWLPQHDTDGALNVYYELSC